MRSQHRPPRVRSHHRLTQREVANSKPAKGRRATMFADGGCLFLQASNGVGGHIRRSWVFKYELNGERHELGLGPLRDVSLVEAREKASRFRKQLLNGVDPFAVKHQEAIQRRLDAAKAMTFGQCVEQYLQTHDAAWKNDKHRGQWRQTLTKHCAAISNLPVKDIDTDLVLRCLTPIWKTKTPTADRLRGRIERVLAWATSRGLRVGENPARWSGHLSEMLAAPKKVRRIKHHPALPYPELPAFVAELKQTDSASARVMEFLILTACRTGEVLNAHQSEFDLDRKIWTIPAARMKGGREHRVPLSNRAVEIIKQFSAEKPFDFGERTMLSLLNRMRPGFVVHGFRSTFRTWISELTNFPNHVAEMALAHSIGNAVEASYRRGDLFEKRKRLMQAWSDYCARPTTAATVTPFRKLSDA